MIFTKVPVILVHGNSDFAFPYRNYARTLRSALAMCLHNPIIGGDHFREKIEFFIILITASDSPLFCYRPLSVVLKVLSWSLPITSVKQ